MKRILIVDDLEQNRYLLEATLRGYGYEIVTSHNGTEALAAARAQPPDLVISDILMPVMDGFALCRAWRADERLRRIPFIFYTATYTDPKDEQLALDLGADRFVLKPQEPQVMSEIVRDVLARGAKPAAPGAAKVLPEEIVTLREYNEALVRKLEKKLTELETTHQQLVADVRLREETEASLRQSEERWRLIIETEPECVKLLDAKGALYQMNPAGLKMLEADSSEQVAQQCIYPLIAPEQRAKFQELTARVFRGESGTLEFQITGLKGGRRWLETHATPLRDEAGTVVSLLGITRDITGHKESEALLACQVKVMEMIATGAPLAGTLDTLLRRMEGYTPDLLCSILLLEADGAHLRHGGAPSLPADYLRAIDGVAIGPCFGSCGTAAFRGEAVIVEDIATDPLWENYRELALSHGLRACWSTPIFDEQRRVLGTFAIYYRQPGPPNERHRQCVDMATHLAATAIARHRDEAALRAKTEELEGYFTNSLDLLCIADTDGFFRRLNPKWEHTLGYPLAELEGRRFLDFIHPDDMDATLAALHKLSSREHVLNFVNRYRHRDGSYRWLEWRSYAENKVIFAVARDVTARRQAEAGLRESEARYHQLFAASPDAVFVVDRTGRFRDCNETAAQRYGYSRAELLQMSAQDLAAPDLREQAATRVKEALATGVAFEWRHRRKDGSELPVEINAKPFEMGGQMFVLSSARDITERKQAEVALRESETRLRLVLDGLGPQMFVGLLDRDGVVLVANRPALEAAGLRMEDVLGHPVHETYWFTYSDAVARRFRAAVQRATQGETVRYDEQIRVAEGRLVWVAFTVNPLRDKAGKVVFLVPSAVVIEERKQAEAALRASHDRLKKVLEVETVGVMFWDLTTGCMTDANDTFLKTMGYSRADVESRSLTWKKLTPPEYVEASLAEIQKFQATGRVGPYEKEYLRKDGTRQWFVFAGSSLGPDTCVEFCVDISDRKQAEAALRESEEKFTRAFRASPVALSISRVSDGRILEVNDGFVRLTGFSAAEIRGRTIGDLGIWVDAAERARALAELQERGCVRDLESSYRSKSGEIRTGLLSAELVQIGGQACSLACVADITERKQAAEKMVEQLDELRRWHDVMLGREERAMELKGEVNALLVRLGQPPRYSSQEVAGLVAADEKVPAANPSHAASQQNPK